MSNFTDRFIKYCVLVLSVISIWFILSKAIVIEVR
jgi:hypothetical protein